MGFLIDLLKANLAAIIATPLAFITILIAAVLVAYRLASWHQAGENKNLLVEKKRIETELGALTEKAKRLVASPQTRSQNAPHAFYQQRHRVQWSQFNEQTRHRFWVAGTSLVAVVEREIVPNCVSQGVDDIRLVLPATDAQTLSYHQLHHYDLQPGANLVHNQIDAADDAFSKLQSQISKLFSADEHRHLRRYSGIMYSNITIFDDDAFIAFYDTSGLGDGNITIHFNAESNPAGFRYVEIEFLRMWESEYVTGCLTPKRKGTSMIFANSKFQVLMYLRDDKPGLPFKNCWDLIGGHIETDETPDQCISREILEEIELAVEAPKLFNIFDFADRIEYTYFAKIDIDILRVRLNEGQRLKWFSEREISALPLSQFAFGFKEVVLSFFESQRRHSGS